MVRRSNEPFRGSISSRVRLKHSLHWSESELEQRYPAESRALSNREQGTEGYCGPAASARQTTTTAVGTHCGTGSRPFLYAYERKPTGKSSSSWARNLHPDVTRRCSPERLAAAVTTSLLITLSAIKRRKRKIPHRGHSTSTAIFSLFFNRKYIGETTKRTISCSLYRPLRHKGLSYAGNNAGILSGANGKWRMLGDNYRSSTNACIIVYQRALHRHYHEAKEKGRNKSRGTKGERKHYEFACGKYLTYFLKDGSSYQQTAINWKSLIFFSEMIVTLFEQSLGEISSFIPRSFCARNFKCYNILYWKFRKLACLNYVILILELPLRLRTQNVRL